MDSRNPDLILFGPESERDFVVTHGETRFHMPRRMLTIASPVFAAMLAPTSAFLEAQTGIMHFDETELDWHAALYFLVSIWEDLRGVRYGFNNVILSSPDPCLILANTIDLFEQYQMAAHMDELLFLIDENGERLRPHAPRLARMWIADDSWRRCDGELLQLTWRHLEGPWRRPEILTPEFILFLVEERPARAARFLAEQVFRPRS